MSKPTQICGFHGGILQRRQNSICTILLLVGGVCWGAGPLDTWTGQYLPNPTYGLYGIAFGEGAYALVGNNPGPLFPDTETFYSFGDTNWFGGIWGLNCALYDAAFGKGVWVAVGWKPGTVQTVGAVFAARPGSSFAAQSVSPELLT